MKTAKNAKPTPTTKATKPAKASSTAKIAQVTKPAGVAKPAVVVKPTKPAKVAPAVKPVKVAPPVKVATSAQPDNLGAQLDALKQTAPKSGMVCWSARDLCKPLGYTQWESFRAVVERAIGARIDAGQGTRFYFRELTTTNADGLIVVNDYRLTRLGCHAVAMIGDVRKKAIVFARTYFAAPPGAQTPAKKPAAKKPVKAVAKAAGKPKSAAKRAVKPTTAIRVAGTPIKVRAKGTKPKAPVKAVGSRFLPQAGDKFYGSMPSLNSRWNPNCAVSRGYHNMAATNGR